MLEEMEEKDIIEPSTAAWLSPIVLVKKPDGTQRMCLDYRKVSTHLQVDIHPLPRLEEMVEIAAGNKYYATLDMKEAYYQVELGEQSRNLTTFSDGASLYRFKRLPFGLSCSQQFSLGSWVICLPLWLSKDGSKIIWMTSSYGLPPSQVYSSSWIPFLNTFPAMESLWSARSEILGSHSVQRLV